MRLIGSLVALTLLTGPLNAQYLYKTTLLRAAPGKLLELIDLMKERTEVLDRAGDERPFMMRHSQGDHWDLLMLFPMDSYQSFYAEERVGKRSQAFNGSSLDYGSFQRKLKECVAWNEEIFVSGPPLRAVQRAFDGAGYFHVEMFVVLPGKHEALFEQREMENIYLKRLGRPQNLIFTRDQGAAWDLFTIGFYRDLKHFAESADIPDEKEDEAARLAGFKAASQIGPYLRTLINRHNDTLAVAVR